MLYIEPYDNDKLEFKEGRYVLTIEEFNNKFTNPFADTGILAKRLEKNSRKIYNYILNNCYSLNQKIVRRLINETEVGRKFIYDVLIEQMEADIDSGYNDVSSQQPLNLTSGQILSRDELRKNQICIDAEQIIDRNADYFGFNILVPHLYTNVILLRLREE